MVHKEQCTKLGALLFWMSGDFFPECGVQHIWRHRVPRGPNRGDKPGQSCPWRWKSERHPGLGPLHPEEDIPWLRLQKDKGPKQGKESFICHNPLVWSQFLCVLGLLWWQSCSSSRNIITAISFCVFSCNCLALQSRILGIRANNDSFISLLKCYQAKIWFYQQDF